MMSSMSEVCKLLNILIVIPCNNGVSEGSVSALHRVKTYNNGSITTDHLIILHIHTKSLESCLIEFVAGSEHRLSLLGHSSCQYY